MKRCGVCNKREAVVAYNHIVDDVKQTLLLCHECASEKNIKAQVAPAAQAKEAPVLVKEIKIELAKLAGAEGDRGARCSTCAMSYEEFKKIGRLGCPHCYDAFASQLERLLKAHPRRRPASGQRAAGSGPKYWRGRRVGAIARRAGSSGSGRGI